MSNFKRIYYKLNIKLSSPLSIGSGAKAQTDRDVIVNNLGNPFIPATAIAGVLRSYIKKKKETASVEVINSDNEKSIINVPLDHTLFGYIPDGILSEEEKKLPENLAMPTLVR
ncbi:MAG: RAMP superfamily CRISPR-associated protein, partial [Ruminococcus sp.]